MRGFDYVGKRVLFAALTVFVAITLNFVLFRTLSGDAVSALRCKQCSQAFKDEQRRDLGLDQSKWVQYKLYLASLARQRVASRWHKSLVAMQRGQGAIARGAAMPGLQPSFRR